MCRSFLSPWKDNEGNYKFDGRFNFGVVSVNLPDVALSAKGDINLFWNILNERVALVKEMGLLRFNQLKDTPSDVAPILWQHGAIARLKKGEKIGKLFQDGYSTYSLGYVGIYETVKILTGDTHTSEEGSKLALDIVTLLREKTDQWKEETGIGFALYGTPSENMAGRLAATTKKRFGSIEDITDKGYFVNSYHVDIREEIDAFSKLSFESPYQVLSSGGTITYVEIPNLQNNIEAVLEIMKHIYNTNIYAEMNTKADLCHICNFDGEIIINDNLEWECPQCHNKNQDEMTVVRRTCGYLGSNYWSEGRTRDIKDRVLHL
nr:anaerobic ribonucleoside-triphosphate reductase [Tissierella sp.]